MKEEYESNGGCRLLMSEEASLIVMFILIFIILTFCSCQKDPWCSCELVIDENPTWVTFASKGCHYCCLAQSFPLTNFEKKDIDKELAIWYAEKLETYKNCNLDIEPGEPYWIYGKVR